MSPPPDGPTDDPDRPTTPDRPSDPLSPIDPTIENAVADPDARATAAVWAGLGLVVAATPYVARPFGFVVATRPVVEVVDHVVPGALALVLAAGFVVLPRFRFELSLAAVLAGLWSTATHVPLLVDAGRGRIDWPTALWHTTPAVLLLAATVWSAVRLLRAEH